MSAQVTDVAPQGRATAGITPAFSHDQTEGAVHSLTSRTTARVCRRIVTVAAFIVGAPGVPAWAHAAPVAAAPTKSTHALPVTAAAQAAPDYAAIVEQYGRAVVHIAASQDAGQQSAATGGLDALAPDDPLSTALPPTASQQDDGQPTRIMWGSGSGFIVAADGLVVTTSHVVNHADEVIVTLTDRRQFKARVLDVDPHTDVALIQLEGASKLPVVKLGDSSRVRAGEPVLAIGAPDGPQNAVTAGLISETSRVLPDGTNFPFFRTDIAVNPDNSGAPLVNRDGVVIGVAVQLYVDAQRYQTLTFAIPIAAAMKLSSRLPDGPKKAGGGSLDITTQDLDPGLAAAFGLPRPQGALVTFVAPPTRGSAAKGLKAGDVITQINGKTVDHADELRDAVSGLAPGSKATLKIIRGKKPMTLSVTVSTPAENAVLARGDTGELDRIGLSVHPLAEDEQRASGLGGGLLVDSASGLAASAGVQPGDVVVSVNGTPVTSREALASFIAAGGSEVALLIVRDNVRTFVSLEHR